MITKSELKEKNKAAGHYFFSRNTMRSFNSKLETGGYYGYKSYYSSEDGGTFGWYFVYSDSTYDGRSREYKVAFMRDDGTVAPGSRPSFGSLREAHQEAKRLAKESMAK